MTSTIWESMPPYFTTSATDASGKEELLTFIDDLNQKVLENS
jgi:GTP-binding protein